MTCKIKLNYSDQCQGLECAEVSSPGRPLSSLLDASYQNICLTTMLENQVLN